MNLKRLLTRVTGQRPAEWLFRRRFFITLAAKLGRLCGAGLWLAERARKLVFIVIAFAKKHWPQALDEIKRRIPRRVTKKGVFKGIRWALGLFVLFFILQAFFRADLVSPPATPIFEDRQGVFLTEGAGEYRMLGFWDMPDEIPARLKECVLVVEDKRYYGHMGMDWWALGRAIYENMFNGKNQGASTIPMQVARLQNPGGRNVFNKFNEMMTGFFMLVRHGHENVLRHYLKIAPQGNQVYGFAYSSRRFFRKPLQDCSWAEAALLASLPKSPSDMNLFDYWGFQRAGSRARLILRLLYTQKRINPEEYQIALQQLSEMQFQLRERRPDSSYHFILRVIQEYKDQPAASGAGHGSSGIRKPLRTTIDLELQDYLAQSCTRIMGWLRNLGAGNLSVMVVKRRTGEVLGYIGSADYFDEYFDGAINYAATPRSSGSTVKPFLYALGLETGKFNPGSILADLPFSIVGPKGEFSLGNFDEEYIGPVLYRRALANSRNIPTMRILEGVGLERAYDYYRKLGLVHDDKTADYYGYGLPVGGLYVTLEDLVQSFGILANDGREFRLKWFADGTTAEAQQHERPGRQVMSQYAAREVTLFLSDPIARLPSFPRYQSLEYPFPVAVKTGTSQGYRDGWVVAYSDEYIVGAWVGHPENRAMNHVSGSVIAYMVNDIMISLHHMDSSGGESGQFSVPDGTVPVKVCIFSGKPAGPDCTAVSLEYFREGTEPHDWCPVHRRFPVDSSTNELATASTPAWRVEDRLFTVLPPEYASWGAKHGYGKPLMDTAEEPEALVKLVYPKDGGRYLIDPGTPRQFQSIALRAEVSPYVPEIIWYVDGEEYARTGYPYETRWNLLEGEHSFQVRFPRAAVRSNVVTVRVGRY